MLQKFPHILSSLTKWFGILNMLSSNPLPAATAVLAWPTPPKLIVFLSQGEFSSWYAQFLPACSLLPGLRLEGCSWFVGEGVWCLLLRKNRVLSGALICYRLSVNDVRQIRGRTADSFGIWNSSLSLLLSGLLGLLGESSEYYVFEEKCFNFSIKFGKPL